MLLLADNSKLTQSRGTSPPGGRLSLGLRPYNAQPLKPHKLLQGVREVLGLLCLGAACDPGVEALLH